MLGIREVMVFSYAEVLLVFAILGDIAFATDLRGDRPCLLGWYGKVLS